MGIAFASETNIGHKRQINEDSLWPKTNYHTHQANEPYGMLFIIADGMGGHGAGDVASELAVEEISRTYYDLGDHYPDIGERLKLAIEEAHQKISSQAGESPDFENMGTTVALAVVKYDEVYEHGEVWVAWAGDSRVYLLRHGRLQQLTKDHTRVWPLVEGGQITWDELHFHPDRSRVTNALTARRTNIVPDVERFELEPGDRLLLCSDGLAGEVRPEEIEQILTTYPIRQALQLLIEKANGPKDLYRDGQVVRLEGGNDNISSILINISSNEPQTVIPLAVPAKPAQPAKQPRFGWIYAAILVALLLVGAGIFLTFFIGGNTEEAEVATPAAIDPPASAAIEVTPLPAVNVEVIVENTATQPPQLTATAPITQAPTVEEAPLPTVTRVNTPTPVPPTFTPIPPPTAIPSMTPTPTLTSEIDPAAFQAPVLIRPEQYLEGQPDFVAGQDITFEWQWPGELPEGYGFEIRIWLPDNDPTGIYDVKELRTILQYTPSEDHKYSVPLKIAGEGIVATDKNYIWSVGLVRLEPYEWLNIESEPRRISIVVPNPGN